jgi:hypothetical protein
MQAQASAQTSKAFGLGDSVNTPISLAQQESWRREPVWIFSGSEDGQGQVSGEIRIGVRDRGQGSGSRIRGRASGRLEFQPGLCQGSGIRWVQSRACPYRTVVSSLRAFRPAASDAM